ncbi:MAG TPA: 6-pyruvoyl-tetrahydropterin synthase-related protein [Candidatus Omnitrophota bacterium]|nr:6-pyruvoyl-tetrahydropterin synthase-related protein [Candidatus Omnitrophota bacterium]
MIPLPGGAAWKGKKYFISEIVVFSLIYLFLISYFSPSLLFLKTVINGGDTGSHFPCAVYLKEYLLPHGKIMGWMPGNYAGFPLFYHYFPLPFVLIALTGFVLPIEIAFKLGTVLGTFLLPLCIYLSFRAMRYDFPAPVAAACFSLAFLFNEGNSMWGGNIPSTLSGEFCYSFGLALALLFLGALYKGAKDNKWRILNVMLLMLIGLSHIYALIFSFLLGVYFIRRNWRYVFSVYTLALLFLAPWLVPVLLNSPYTTAFITRWTVSSVLEVFPPVMLPFILLSAFAFFSRRKDDRTIYLLYAITICAIAYLVFPCFGVLDIRFVPFIQLLLAIFGATVIPGILKGWRMNWLVPIALALAVVLFVSANTIFIRSWINWNYSGYESKASWPVLNGISSYLENSSPGRVAWEHSAADEQLGSIRTHELLPYFAKRETLEGIHMLGSVSAPFVFYIESEMSAQPCNPLPQYEYSQLDLAAAIEHFKLFNVTQFVASSDRVKRAISAFHEFKLEKSFGNYNIYRLTTNPGIYVEPLKYRPFLVKTDNWKRTAYDWFRKKGMQDVHLVFSGDDNRFATGELAPVPYPKKQIVVKAVMLPEKIMIETSDPSRPLLVKVSYHPNWRVTGADRVYLTTPSFMLIFPKEKKITLEFKYGWYF